MVPNCKGTVNNIKAGCLVVDRCNQIGNAKFWMGYDPRKESADDGWFVWYEIGHYSNDGVGMSREDARKNYGMMNWTTNTLKNCGFKYGEAS